MSSFFKANRCELQQMELTEELTNRIHFQFFDALELKTTIEVWNAARSGERVGVGQEEGSGHLFIIMPFSVGEEFRRETAFAVAARTRQPFLCS